MANHMAEVAKILGVELGEKFAIVKRRNKEIPLFCKFHEDGLYYHKNHNGWATDSFSDLILKRLLIGKEEIQKLHDEGKVGDL